MQSQYGIAPDEDDATDDSGEALVMNISDEEVRFKIATSPGSKPRRYTLAPFGREGSTIHLQRGYCVEFQGAGRNLMEPIIERITKREAYPSPGVDAQGARLPAGRALPMVVHEDKAPEARERWLAEHTRREANRRQPVMVHLEVNPNLDAPARVKSTRGAPAGPPVKMPRGAEEVGQDSDFDDNDPIMTDDDAGAPVIASGPPGAPTAPMSSPSSKPSAAKKDGK